VYEFKREPYSIPREERLKPLRLSRGVSLLRVIRCLEQTAVGETVVCIDRQGKKLYMERLPNGLFNCHWRQGQQAMITSLDELIKWYLPSK
jgi:hypothetical protein